MEEVSDGSHSDSNAANESRRSQHAEVLRASLQGRSNKKDASCSEKGPFPGNLVGDPALIHRAWPPC